MFRKYNCTVLLRENIGRDIGAYQCGIHFLGIDQLAEKFDKVALLNDSLYVTDHSVRFYENFLTNNTNE
jgi:lipopolysaccharide biosynthesis protein